MLGQYLHIAFKTTHCFLIYMSEKALKHAIVLISLTRHMPVKLNQNNKNKQSSMLCNNGQNMDLACVTVIITYFCSI